MSKIRPRILNWLCFMGLVLLFGWCIYGQFYKSDPEVPEPENYRTDMMLEDGPTVKVVYGQNIDLVSPTFADESIYPTLKSKPDDKCESKEEKDIQQLKLEISRLELQRMGLEDNVKKLEVRNSQLSKLSADVQREIINFVEKHRWGDMILSAFIGALVSMVFNFVLNLPSIRDRIREYFWKISR